MKQVFADTGYSIAILDPKDTLHIKAKDVSEKLEEVIIVTSEMVLVEFANYFAGKGKNFREMAIKTINNIRSNPNVVVIQQTSLQFQSALELYSSHKDKEWSLTDCASIHTMREQNIEEILAHDQHFIQAGFKSLLRT